MSAVSSTWKIPFLRQQLLFIKFLKSSIIRTDFLDDRFKMSFFTSALTIPEKRNPSLSRILANVTLWILLWCMNTWVIDSNGCETRIRFLFNPNLFFLAYRFIYLCLQNLWMVSLINFVLLLFFSLIVPCRTPRNGYFEMPTMFTCSYISIWFLLIRIIKRLSTNWRERLVFFINFLKK